VKNSTVEENSVVDAQNPQPPSLLNRRTNSRFTAEEIAGLLRQGATPAFCRAVLQSFVDKEEWLSSPFLKNDSELLRFAEPFSPNDGTHVLTISDPLYPVDLLDLQSPPPVLFVKGNLKSLSRGVGIVGSRSMTEFGSLVATLSAASASAIGATVVSGLARGVDSTAHEVATAAPSRTLAFVGCGLDALDERQSQLSEKIIATGGAICSESLPETPTSPGLLIARNRLIAAMSYPLVVVEGTLDSGTTHTVRDAAKLGRPMVVALPKEKFRSLPSAKLPLVLADPPKLASSAFKPPLVFENVPSSSYSAANAVCETREDLDNAIKVFWWLHANENSPDK
jgi:DNA protecting protein DprA